MTATMNSNEFNIELASVQTEINKVIYYHQLLLLNNNKNSNNGVKSRLKAYEKKLEQLSERQKIVLDDLRKERLNVSNLEPNYYKQVNFQTTGPNKQFLMQNQPTLLKPKKTFLNAQQDKQQQQIKSFTGQKLLMPNEQMLVVSTPGGGARLVTTSTNPSRSTFTKSFTVTDKSNNAFTNTTSINNSLLNNNTSVNKTTQFNNFTITNTTKPLTTTTLTTNINLQNSKAANDKTTLTNHLLPVEVLTNSSLNKRKSVIQPLVDKQDKNELRQPIKPVPVVQEPIKPEPPKVDEAKVKEDFFASLGLVTKKALSEIQNKKSERKRRTTANPQFSSAAIEAKRISALELAAKKAKKRELAATNQNNKLLNNQQQQQGNKRVFLNSNRGKPVGKQDGRRSGLNNNKASKQANNQTQNSGIKISQNCFVCEEVCDSDYDAIMFCTDCKCLFHATCSSTVDLIKKTMDVPCPKCATKRSLNDELSNFNENSNEAESIHNQANNKMESNSSTSSSVISSSRASSRRKLNQSKNSKVISNKLNSSNEQAKGNNKVLGELSKTESKLDEEKNKILMRHYEVNKQIREFKQKLALLKDKVCVSKENRKEMLTKKEDSIKSIDSIISLVRRIQEQTIEQKENQEKQCELVGKLNNELSDELNDNLANKDTAPIDKLISVIENSSMNELSESETKTSEDNLSKNQDNVDEAASVLTNLSTTLNNDEELSTHNPLQSDNLVKKEITVELTDKEKDLMQDYSEVEKEVIQNLINYSNSTMENQLHETSVVVVPAQLQIEPLNGDKVSQIIVDNQNNLTNDHQIEDVSTDEPPIKKQRTSPVSSPRIQPSPQPLERKMNTIEDVIMNEIDLAIASIPN